MWATVHVVHVRVHVVHVRVHVVPVPVPVRVVHVHVNVHVHVVHVHVARACGGARARTCGARGAHVVCMHVHEHVVHVHAVHAPQRFKSPFFTVSARAWHGRIPDHCVDFFHDLRGLRHPQHTFYALKPTAPMNCEPRKLTRPRRGRSGPIYAQNFEIAAVIA